LEADDSSPLREAAPGAWVRIYKVSDESTGALDYLGERGLVPGRLLHVEEIRDLDGVVTVRDGDGGTYALGEPLARSVFVRNEPRQRF
jgi:DtxR family transcriptional regulator, Mn-dependent transcriptional regulator